MPKTIDNPAQLNLDLFALQPVTARADNIPAVVHPRPQPARIPNLKLADKLDKLAATMQKTIDSKLHPAIANQNITARRSRIAASMREEGQQLALIQRWLEGLAQSHRTVTCPARFAKIDNRKQLEDFAMVHRWHEEESHYLRDCFTYGYSIVERLKLFGIKSSIEAISAVEQLNELCQSPAPEIDRAVEKANELRRRAIYTKVPDFFPTPPAIIDRMLDILNVEPSHRVLDPSAGAGDMCLAVRELGVSIVDCFEVNWDLTQALTLLGFSPLGRDFLEAEVQPLYERILVVVVEVYLFGCVNSKDAYIEHVRAAYDWLAPSGELVAVLPNGYRDSRITQRREFADWLDSLGANNPHSASPSDRKIIKTKP